MEIWRKKTGLIALILLLAAGLLAYSNSFGNQLFWDDDDVITNNAYIKDFSYLPEYFSQNLIAGSGQVTNYWRPLLLISFAADYHLFGLAPWGYHLTNLLWHVLAGWLLFLLFRRLGAKEWLAGAVSLLFILHPLQTEAVTYVAGRADPMAAALGVGVLLAYVYFRQRNEKKFLYLSLGAFILALLTKEQSIMLPGLIFMIEAAFFFRRQAWRSSLFPILAFAGISVAYFLLRITVLDFNDILGGMDYDQGYDSNLGVRLLTFTYVFSKYIYLLFVPANLHMAYEIEPVVSVWSWSVFSFAILGVLFGYLIIRSWKKNRLVSFGLAWFLILLLPRTNIISINRPLYEHWLYLPMAGFWLAILALIGKAIGILAKRRKDILRIIAIAVFVAIIVILATLTIRRNRDWHDPITFYEKNIRYTPNSYIQHNNLGMAYAAAGRLEEAEKEYRRSLELDQRYPQVSYNLGNVLASQGRLEEAEKEYHRSIGISSEFTLPYVSLIRLAIAQQDVVALEETILLMEKNFPPEYSLKQAFYAYYALGNAEKARVIGRQYLSLYPGDEEIGLTMLEMR